MSCTASIRGSASLRDERKDARNITIVVANSLFTVPGNQEFVFVETGWHPGDHTQPGSDKKKIHLNLLLETSLLQGTTGYTPLHKFINLKSISKHLKTNSLFSCVFEYECDKTSFHKFITDE